MPLKVQFNKCVFKSVISTGTNEKKQLLFAIAFFNYIRLTARGIAVQ